MVQVFFSFFPSLTNQDDILSWKQRITLCLFDFFFIISPFLRFIKNCKVDLFRWLVVITASPTQDSESFLQNMTIINFGFVTIHLSQAHTIRTSDNMLRNHVFSVNELSKEAPEGKQVLLPSLPQILLLFPSLNQ